VMTRDRVVGLPRPGRNAARCRSACSATPTASRRSPARSTSSARSSCATSCPASRRLLGPEGIESRIAVEGARARSASSSTSTSRDPTRAWRPGAAGRARRMGEILAREAPVDATS
jgi:hypothetical protein